MGSRQAYVGSLSILKLFAVNIWVHAAAKSQAEQTILHSYQKSIFYWGRNKYITFLQFQSTGLIKLLYTGSW